ncbi:MAG: hypothetical protein K2I95_07090, partial [Treponemataceae bacterium]|nr:hypothetical protein [Treponemataceae bacterium]
FFLMKKLIGTAMLAALLATSAFAEINFGAWLRTMIVPVSGDGDDVKAFMANSWWNNLRPARLDITGVTEDERAGMRLQFFPENLKSDDMIGDNAYMWVKPWDWIRVSAGKMGDNDTGLRGDLTYGSWGWVRPGNWIRGDEGLTFSDIGGVGARVELFPVEGLKIVGFIPYPASAEKAYKVYEGTAIAAAYEIDGIGRIKAQWLGKFEKNEAKDKYTGDIELAFDLTAVENLYLTVGAKIGIMDSDYFVNGSKATYKWKAPTSASDATLSVEEDAKAGDDSLAERAVVALGVSYNVLENFKISVSGGVAFYNKPSGVDADPRWNIGLGLDYGLTDALTLTADVRYLSKLKVEGEKIKNDSLSFLIGLDYACSSNAVIGIGFQGATNGNGFAGGNLANGDKFAWAVPLKVQLAL